MQKHIHTQKRVKLVSDEWENFFSGVWPLEMEGIDFRWGREGGQKGQSSGIRGQILTWDNEDTWSVQLTNHQVRELKPQAEASHKLILVASS